MLAELIEMFLLRHVLCPFASKQHRCPNKCQPYLEFQAVFHPCCPMLLNFSVTSGALVSNAARSLSFSPQLVQPPQLSQKWAKFEAVFSEWASKPRLSFLLSNKIQKAVFFLLWDQVDKLLLPNLIFIRIIQLSLSHTEGKFNEALMTCNHVSRAHS